MVTLIVNAGYVTENMYYTQTYGHMTTLLHQQICMQTQKHAAKSCYTTKKV